MNGSLASVFVEKSDKKKAILKPSHHLIEVEVTLIVVNIKINNNTLESQKVERETEVWSKILGFQQKQVPQRKHIVPHLLLVHRRFDRLESVNFYFFIYFFSLLIREQQIITSLHQIQKTNYGIY